MSQDNESTQQPQQRPTLPPDEQRGIVMDIANDVISGSAGGVAGVVAAKVLTKKDK